MLDRSDAQYIAPKNCTCKGTGLIPLNERNKVYCPIHRIKRNWPQLQKDGSVIYIPLEGYNRSI